MLVSRATGEQQHRSSSMSELLELLSNRYVVSIIQQCSLLPYVAILQAARRRMSKRI